jgi:hypothetical protein
MKSVLIVWTLVLVAGVVSVHDIHAWTSYRASDSFSQLDSVQQLEASNGVLQAPIGLQASPSTLQVGINVR